MLWLVPYQEVSNSLTPPFWLTPPLIFRRISDKVLREKVEKRRRLFFYPPFAIMNEK